MSVRQRSWKDPEGKMQTAWFIDVKFTPPGGQAIRVRECSPINTRAGATQHERTTLEQLVKGTHPKVKVATVEKTVPTLAEFRADLMVYASNNNKATEVQNKRMAFDGHLIPFFGHLKLNAITVAEVERFKNEKKRDPEQPQRGGLSPKAVNNLLTILRKTLNYAVELGVLDRAPKIRPLKVQDQGFQYLEFEETPRFLEAVNADFKPMCTIAVLTGLRIGELLALRWTDVDLKAGRLVVRQARNNYGHVTSPKNGKSREVALSQVAIDTLRAHKGRGKVIPLQGEDWVFTDGQGGFLTHNRCRNVVERASRKAGLAKVLTWHDLRHTFASQLVMRGVPLLAVKELLGHSTITMTMRYAHLSPDVKRDAVKLLDQGLTSVGQGTYRAHGS